MTAEFCQAWDIDVFAKHLPMDWVAKAVQQTGRVSLRTRCFPLRTRRFPAEQAVWLVLGIGLMRNRSLQQVCDKLSLAFPDAKGELPPLGYP
ncbi:MAG: transposase domain-containing protein [Shewanella sp.]|nr:transposase domain-containing protein [Shewanella sp.]MCF1457077.1 transposase domain-containing protein [Shewanella sp.]